MPLRMKYMPPTGSVGGLPTHRDEHNRHQERSRRKTDTVVHCADYKHHSDSEHSVRSNYSNDRYKYTNHRDSLRSRDVDDRCDSRSDRSND